METYENLPKYINKFLSECRENQNNDFMFNKFFSKYCAIYEIMWKHTVEPDMPQMTL